MIKHLWTLITRQSNIDQETKNIIIGEVLEDIQFDLPLEAKEKFDQEIKTSKQISIPLVFEIVSCLSETDANLKPQIRFEVELPNGHRIDLGNLEAVFGKNGKVHIRLRSSTLPISGPGVNTFRLLQVAGKESTILSEVPLTITINFKALDPKKG